MVEKNTALSPVDVEEPHKQQQFEDQEPQPVHEEQPRHREATQGNEPYEDPDARYRYRNKDPAKRDAPILLSWRIGLFLFTSTWVQNLSYVLANSVAYGNFLNWTAPQSLKFSSLVYTMVYLGPFFGLSMDMFRVFGERYRPSIIVGCVFNLVVCFIMFGKTTPIVNSFYGSLILSWVMEVATIYIYTPMNVVCIRYANRCFYNSLSYEYDRLNEKLGFKGQKHSEEEVGRIRNVESTARVGTIMAQAMVWRTLGTFTYNIFDQFAKGRGLTPHVKPRWYVFMAGVGSAILILQVLFLMKRKYFLDYNANDSKVPVCTKLVRDAFKVKRASMGRTHKPIGTNFMFILCFIFLYMMIPDVLYNTRYDLYSNMSTGFSARWKQSYTILSNLGSLLGAIAYALWMTLAYVMENRRHRRRLHNMRNQTQQLKGRRNSSNEPMDEEGHHNSDSDDDVDHEDSLRLVDKPYFYSPWQAGTVVIVFAGCFVWAFGSFFHMIGEMGRHNSKFNFRVFLLFETIISNACIRFSLMPTLSLLAIHCPFDYEAASFCLYSMDTFGGGVVSYALTTSVGSALGFNYVYPANSLKNYWKLCLLCIFFQFFPMLIAPALPKCRKDIRMNVENVEDWKIDDNNRAVNCTHDVTVELREVPRLDTQLPEERETDQEAKKKIEDDQ